MMDMLWYDGGKGCLADRVSAAAVYYLKKYHAWPRRVMVNPLELSEDQKTPTAAVDCANGSIRVEASRNVLPKHLVLGNG